MTEEQFWDKDCCLVKAFKEADELKRERLNQVAWLQGMYIYDAISRLVPLLSGNAKKGTKAKPYVEEPYALTKEHARNKDVEKEKKRSERGRQYMHMFMAKTNEKLKEEGEA